MSFTQPVADLPVLGTVHRAQRSRGRLNLGFGRRGPVTALLQLRQEGCLKVRFPRPEPGAAPEAVILNTAGGITGGDDLTLDFHAAQGSRAVITTQAAERFYRATTGSPPATISTRITVDEGAALDWLPQEAILFEGCRVNRTLNVDLAAGAQFLGIETLLFGRVAMGEVLRDATFRDRIAIRIGGWLVFQDMLRLEGDLAALMARAAIAADARALATIVMISPDGEGMVPILRERFGGGRMEDGAVEVGVSARNGVLLVRALAADGADLRRSMIGTLNLLRGDDPLPRAWRL
jgi:urease accessory protein